MTSDKKNISLLTDIFIKSGLTDIVISPGSRNAPIIISFANNHNINAYSVVDERSAAFFAMGLALQTRKTVAIACTSGSAVLNYAPAIAEAYYQKIPLLILTADRPQHLIDVGDGQTIRQTNIFGNYVKNSYNLPMDIDSTEDFDSAQIMINKAISDCVFPAAGPVHINIPFDEPIYNFTDVSVSGKVMNMNRLRAVFPDDEIRKVAHICDGSKVMVIVGQHTLDDILTQLVNELAQKSNFVVLTETTSNVYGDLIIDTIDNIISSIDANEVCDFKPDVVISIGGHVVSKMIKKFIRANKPNYHWHLSPSGDKMNTYFCLTDAFATNEIDFLVSFIGLLRPTNSNYSKLWHTRKQKKDNDREKYLSTIGYSDFLVYNSIVSKLPKDCVLHLGNSTPVRYSQLFGSTKGVVYNSNRGVSGIDGQVSTAVGYAYKSNKLNVLITGDLGFFYDSNGLMNKYLESNLRIIIINNSGGGIFKFIPGPDTTPNVDEFFVAAHNWKAEHICKAFGVAYQSVDSIETLDDILDVFFMIQDNGAQVLEIFTPIDKNALILRDYFNFAD